MNVSKFSDNFDTFGVYVDFIDTFVTCVGNSENFDIYGGLETP